VSSTNVLSASAIGQPVERLEDARLLRGRGQFVDDLHAEGMLHAVVVRSAVAHGNIRALHTGSAHALPGVHAVYTAADVAASYGNAVPVVPLRVGSFAEVEPFGQPVIAQHKVRYVGEPLAIVVADSVALAEDAADVVQADIESLPAIVDRESALQDRSLLFDATGSNRVVTYSAVKGNAASVEAAYRRCEKFRVHRHSAVFMEPRGLLADWRGAQSHMIVTGSAKVPFANRRMLMRCMDLPEECVEMRWSDFGGGFGVRGEFYPEDFLVPFAARKLGRPVKWVEDRRENLLAANHAREIDCELEIACTRDGQVLALKGHAYVNVGAYYRMSGAVQPRNVAQFICGPYRVPNVDMQATVLVSNKTPTGAYRGPGRFEADFFRERLFDMAARDLNIEPVEFRRRNLVSKEELPYPIATLTPVESREELDNGDYTVTLERCLAEIRWTDRSAQVGKRQADGRYYGLGIGCFVEGGGAGPKETARLVLHDDGTVDVHVGSVNLGQGMETVFTQIAADALGIPMDRIRLFHGSTNGLSEGFGSFHSRSVVMGGSAVLLAADALKKKMHADARRPLEADGVFHSHRHTYAYGAAAAHVAVDPKTGHVELLEYVTVQDVGRIMNPLTCAGQAVGAVAQGLGGVFLEHMAYDEDGQFLSGSLADYMMPSATDFPKIRAIVLENSPSPFNPLGAKGAGEGGIVPVAGVVANAVASALAPLGVVPRELPLSPPKLWSLIQSSRMKEQ
jgi:aerobic carbon-monoxide dehydrogenase large subunit